MKKKLLVTAIIIAAVLLIFIYGRYNPEEVGLYPKCPFYALTGLKCPGCGSQRAIHSILNLNIRAAFQYNAFLVCMIPVIAVFAVAEVYRRRFPRLYNTLFGPYCIIGILILTIVWWVLRLTTGI